MHDMLYVYSVLFYYLCDVKQYILHFLKHYSYICILFSIVDDDDDLNRKKGGI